MNLYIIRSSKTKSQKMKKYYKAQLEAVHQELKETYVKYYHVLPKAQRERLDAVLKINAYAVADVGQGLGSRAAAILPATRPTVSTSVAC